MGTAGFPLSAKKYSKILFSRNYEKVEKIMICNKLPETLNSSLYFQTNPSNVVLTYKKRVYIYWYLSL